MNVNFDKYDIKIRDNQIYCIVRKKWLKTTEEEMVRQIWVHYLAYTLNIYLGLIAVEKAIKYNDKTKRFDIVVYDQKGDINILIECKRPKVVMNQTILNQILIYSKVLNPKILVISNGISHIGIKIENGMVREIESLV